MKTIFILVFCIGSVAAQATKTDWDNLVQYIKNGQLSGVTKIVPSKIKAYEKTRGGRYLFAISRFENKQNITDYLAWQAIIPAIENNNLEVVKALIDGNYLAPDAKTKGGRSLIEIAQYHKKPAIEHYLQEKLSPTQAPTGTPTRIEFYNRGEPYYEFTNFFEGRLIDLDGQLWKTSEHYFQAMKFTDPALQQKIHDAYSAREVFDLANSKSGTYKNFIRKDWDLVKDAIMYKVVSAKFSQDPRLKKLLLQTYPAELVEASPVDAYWGYGPDKKGKNQLGKTLMQVRDALRINQKPPAIKNLYQELSALAQRL